MSVVLVVFTPRHRNLQQLAGGVLKAGDGLCS